MSKCVEEFRNITSLSDEVIMFKGIENESIRRNWKDEARIVKAIMRKIFYAAWVSYFLLLLIHSLMVMNIAGYADSYTQVVLKTFFCMALLIAFISRFLETNEDFCRDFSAFRVRKWIDGHKGGTFRYLDDIKWNSAWMALFVMTRIKEKMVMDFKEHCQGGIPDTIEIRGCKKYGYDVKITFNRRGRRISGERKVFHFFWMDVIETDKMEDATIGIETKTNTVFIPQNCGVIKEVPEREWKKKRRKDIKRIYGMR